MTQERYVLLSILTSVFLLGLVSFSQAQTHTQPSSVLRTSEELKPASTATATTATATSTIDTPATSSAPADANAFQKEVAAHRALLAKKTQDRVYNLLQNITGRMNAVVFRFNNITYRTESRMAILKEQGKPTGDAQAHLTKTHEALTNATRILTSDLGSFAMAQNPQERFVNVRVQIKETGAYLTDAQNELRATIRALTESSQALTPAATSSSAQ